MGVNCFLTPFQPDKWETEKSDLVIDPSELENALIEKWPDTTIYPEDDRTSELLLWNFNHKGHGGLINLMGDGQIVSFMIDVYLFDFIQWYRSYIPDKYPIFFSCDCYDESYFLQINESTKESDLEQHVSR